MMKKFMRTAISALVSIVAALLIWPVNAAACPEFPQPRLPTADVRIIADEGAINLLVELASTEEQRQCGLMGRPAPPPSGGMLFDMRPAGAAYFWMKNTPAPLDMVFIEPGGRVVHIVEDTVPYSLEPVGTDTPTAAVLEVASGAAARLGLRIGSRVVLPWHTK